MVDLDPRSPTGLFEPINGKCCFIPDDEQERAGRGDETIGCHRLAEFEVEDPSVRDPYSRSTFACTAHVGELLGFAGELEVPPECKVRAAEVECKACAARVLWLPEELEKHARLIQDRSDGSKGTCAAFWEATPGTSA